MSVDRFYLKPENNQTLCLQTSRAVAPQATTSLAGAAAEASTGVTAAAAWAAAEAAAGVPTKQRSSAAPLLHPEPFVVDTAPLEPRSLQDRIAFSWESSPRKVAAWAQPLPPNAGGGGSRPEWNGSTLIRAATFDDLRSQYRWRKQLAAMGGLSRGVGGGGGGGAGAVLPDHDPEDDSYLDDPEFLRYAQEQHAEVLLLHALTVWMERGIRRLEYRVMGHQILKEISNMKVVRLVHR